MLSRAKSSPDLLLRAPSAAEGDNLTNSNACADSDKPSKSRRKVAEMIDDLNVALGLKKGRLTYYLLAYFERVFRVGFSVFDQRNYKNTNR